MVDCGGPEGSFFDDKAIAPYGVKLMGGFRFMPLEGETALPEAAYKSPGHNSAIYDEATGRYFLVFHTRFSALGEEHRVRVHQFWLNEESWPIVSPFQYVGEAPEGEEIHATQNLLGEYRIIRHGREINRSQHRSALITLDKDGSIADGAVGEWARTPEGVFNMTLDGTAFEGRLEKGYDLQQGAWTTLFTLLSSEGEALWGTRTVNQ